MSRQRNAGRNGHVIRAEVAVAGATGRVGHHVVGVLTEQGHQVVPMSRMHGVDVISGEGLAAALAGVECVIDTATGPSPEQQAATQFFTTAGVGPLSGPRSAGVAWLPGEPGRR